ncbi:MAG: AbrB/MazE/SpoVT family DNA-binding domain-containing protein [bacterium]
MAIIDVSPKGQVIIPAPLRKKFGIRPKSKVEVTEVNNEIVIIPLSKEQVRGNRVALKNKQPLTKPQTLGELLKMYGSWEDKRSASEIVGEIYQARKSRQQDILL